MTRLFKRRWAWGKLPLLLPFASVGLVVTEVVFVVVRWISQMAPASHLWVYPTRLFTPLPLTLTLQIAHSMH